MSNHPTPPQRPSNNPLINFLSTIFNFITNSRLANFAQIYPFLIPLLLALATIIGIVGLDLKASFAILNSNQICKIYEIQVRERLRIEGHENISIETKSFVDKNSNINQWLPFSCEYTIIENTTTLGSTKISIELNPLFPDLINDIDSNFEEEIKMDSVCAHETIKEQMEFWSREKGHYKEGDKIVPGKAELLKSKKGLYPVFRWVCNYEIITQETQQNGLQARTDHNIDLKLEKYCEKKAEENGKGRIKPTHHNYKDPYSLYCVKPYPPNN